MNAAIQRGLDELPKLEGEVLAFAAIARDRFTPGLAAACLGRDLEDVETAFERLQHADWMHGNRLANETLARAAAETVDPAKQSSAESRIRMFSDLGVMVATVCALPPLGRCLLALACRTGQTLDASTNADC